MLKLHKAVKRQQFLLRLETAKKNLRSGKVKKVSFDKLIESFQERPTK